MAKLKAAERNALPASKFGLPGARKFPMPDKSHAANAKSRASQAVNEGRMSKSTEQKIDAKANRVMGSHGSKMLGAPGSHLTEHGMQGKHPSDMGIGHKNVKNPSVHKAKLAEC